MARRKQAGGEWQQCSLNDAGWQETQTGECGRSRVGSLSLRTFRLAALIALCCLAVCTAFGASITVFNTGQGPAGTLLAAEEMDSHYSLIAAPSILPIPWSANATPSPEAGNQFGSVANCRKISGSVKGHE